MQSWKVEMIDCPTIFLDSKLLFECFQLWEPPKVSQRVGEQKHFHLDAEIVFIDLFFFLKLEFNLFFFLPSKTTWRLNSVFLLNLILKASCSATLLGLFLFNGIWFQQCKVETFDCSVSLEQNWCLNISRFVKRFKFFIVLESKKNSILTIRLFVS